MNPDNDSNNAICQVCGESINGAGTAYCSKCDTPHHSDCFQYNGKCSIYACGNNKYYSEKNKQQLDTTNKNQTILNSITDLVINENQLIPKKRSLYGRYNSFSSHNEYSRFLQTNLVSGKSNFEQVFDTLKEIVDKNPNIELPANLILDLVGQQISFPLGTLSIFHETAKNIYDTKRRNASSFDSFFGEHKYKWFDGFAGLYTLAVPFAYCLQNYLPPGYITCTAGFIGAMFGLVNQAFVEKKEYVKLQIKDIKNNAKRKIENLSERRLL